jgi:uncharacterized protein (DUF983 family)
MPRLAATIGNPTLRLFVLVGRALRLRCPNCGGGPIFESWFRMRERCPRCGLRLERGEQGYVVGAYMFNIMAAELIFAGIFLGIAWVTWPHPPWTTLQYGGGAFMVLAPLICYPFSKTLFLAFDLYFRPVRPEDLDPASSRAV